MPASNLGPSSDLSLAMLGLHAMKYGQRRRIRPRSPADPHGVTDPAWRTLDACEQSWPFFERYQRDLIGRRERRQDWHVHCGDRPHFATAGDFYPFVVGRLAGKAERARIEL